MDIIAFTGKMEAGKSTAAAAVMLSLGKNYHSECFAFAEPMKHIAEEYFYFSQASLYTTDGKTWKNPTWGMTSREFLQKFGQGMRDLIDKDVWVKLMELRIERTIDDKKIGNTLTNVILIDDLRMENEASMLKDLGATIIKINRDSHVAKSKGLANHPSEQGVPDKYIDFTINNDGTKHDLCLAVMGILDQLGLEHSML